MYHPFPFISDVRRFWFAWVLTSLCSKVIKARKLCFEPYLSFPRLNLTARYEVHVLERGCNLEFGIQCYPLPPVETRVDMNHKFWTTVSSDQKISRSRLRLVTTNLPRGPGVPSSAPMVFVISVRGVRRSNSAVVSRKKNPLLSHRTRTNWVMQCAGMRNAER